MSFSGHSGVPGPLSGQVAIVTGASQGLGRDYVQSLLQAGCRVAAFSRDPQAAEQAVQQGSQQSQGFMAVGLDLTDRLAVREAVNRVAEKFGSISLLVNNASFGECIGPLWEVDLETWWHSFRVNIQGSMNCIHAVLPAMVRQGRGRIVNLVSTWGEKAQPQFSAYCSSKSALIRLTEVLAKETAGTGVSVFGLGPGAVLTPSVRSLLKSSFGPSVLAQIQADHEQGAAVLPEASQRLLMAMALGLLDDHSGRHLTAGTDWERLMSGPFPSSDTPTLISAEWSTTLACTFRCAHCGINGNKAMPGELTTQEAMALLADFRELGVSQLSLTGGEFLARPDWVQILRVALESSKKIYLATNGWLWKQLVDGLAGMPNQDRLHLAVSLDGMRPFHDARRRRGSFDRIGKLFQHFPPERLFLRTTVGTDNLDQLGALRDFLGPTGASWAFVPLVPLGRAANMASLNASQQAGLADFIQETRRMWGDNERVGVTEWFAGMFDSLRAPGPVGCRCGQSHVQIWPDGTVTACHVSVNNLWGNCKTTGLASLWRQFATLEPMTPCPLQRFMLGESSGVDLLLRISRNPYDNGWRN